MNINSLSIHLRPTLYQGVKPTVQLKSSIPSGAKVEVSTKGFTQGVKAEIEKIFFNLLAHVTNKCSTLWPCIGPKAE
jgi:hypothetical protein